MSLLTKLRGKSTDFKITATANSIRFQGNPEQMRFAASRLLPPDLARQYDIEPPLAFTQPIPGSKIPPGSGMAYVFSPYQEYYTKLYGAIQIADLTKYRLMYRSQPDVMARINKRVLLAIGKGFSVTCDKPEGAEAAKFLKKWCDILDLQSKMWFIAIDMLVYGNAFLEIIWNEMQTTQIELDPVKAERTDSAERFSMPKRPWVEETAICPACHDRTLYMIRYMDHYTFYGDVKAAAAWKCTNPVCGITELTENLNEVKPYEGTKDGKMLEEILDARLNAQDASPLINPQAGQPNLFSYDRKDQSSDTVKIEKRGPREQPLTNESGEVISPAATVIVNLKGIDPIYMRARADSFGNIFGYYQWLNYPPVLIPPESILHFKWNEQTWGYETIYGTAILMPLVRYWDMRTVFENDAAAWFHTFAKPMIHVQGGTPENPYSNNEMTQLSQMIAKQKSGSSLVTKGNVNVNMLGSAVGGRSTQFISDWLNYLNTRFKEILGVPDALMGQSGAGGSNRSTVTVGLEDLITETEMLQGKISRPFENQIFPALLRVNGFAAVADLPYHILFKAVFEEDPNTRSARLVQYRNSSLISINEARKQIPDITSIAKDADGYKPELDDVLYVPPKPAMQMGAGGPPGAPGGAGDLSPTNLTEPQGVAETGNVKAQRLQAEVFWDARTGKRYIVAET